jgi:hypothetical protein
MALRVREQMSITDQRKRRVDESALKSLRESQRGERLAGYRVFIGADDS